MAAAQQAAAASVRQSFPFRAAVLALCVALLPLLPAQAPEGLAEAGVGQAFLAKAWELVHLLVVGIAVSYGLFSRKNSADDGRGAFAPLEKEDARPTPADARYVSRMFRDSLAPFDDDEEETLLPDAPGDREDEGGGNVRYWSAMHRPDAPVVVVSNGGRASNAQAPLPVRALKPQDSPPRGRDETVLPSPIPWRSRSGRFDAIHQPASSSSRETLAKATEEHYSSKRRSPRRPSSTTVSSPPPAPPPPPPPFLVHGYHPATERRAAAAAKSFKEELQDHSMRGQRVVDRYSFNTTSSFDVSATYTTTNASFDGGSSSSPASVAKSVRTFRAREPPVFEGPSQEVPKDDVRDGAQVHGPEEPYGYRVYQSIPRFQYERSVSDPILGGVTVSSDETESSDDDDDHVGSASSTRESTPEVDENEVDKKAEEFIARFREQIRRQRIESIKRSAGPRGVKHSR
jgi:hypothetical protein